MNTCSCHFCNGYGFVNNTKTRGLTRRCMYCNAPKFEFGFFVYPNMEEVEAVRIGQVAETMSEAFEEIAEMLDENEIERRFN